MGESKGLVDVKNEVALAYKMTDTKTGDGETLPEILAEAQANSPPGRIRTLAYDKAVDTNEVHEVLSRTPLPGFTSCHEEVRRTKSF